MKDILLAIATVVIPILIIWGAMTAVSKMVKEQEVISPDPGVKCVVVSRMFNLSVDCWGVEQ